MKPEAEQFALKVHEEVFKEFKLYMGNKKPELDKYYSNMIKKQVLIVIKHVEKIYPYESRSAEFMREVQRNVSKI